MADKEKKKEKNEGGSLQLPPLSAIMSSQAGDLPAPSYPPEPSIYAMIREHREVSPSNAAGTLPMVMNSRPMIPARKIVSYLVNATPPTSPGTAAPPTPTAPLVVGDAPAPVGPVATPPRRIWDIFNARRLYSGQ